MVVIKIFVKIIIKFCLYTQHNENMHAQCEYSSVAVNCNQQTVEIVVK
jgi:hypothetical protein